MEHFASRGLGTGEPTSRDLRRAETQAAVLNPIRVDASPPPKPSSFLAATVNELDVAIKNLAELNNRLSRLADRVFGSVPEATGGIPEGVMSGASSEIEQRVNAIHVLVGAAHSTASRLESL